MKGRSIGAIAAGIGANLLAVPVDLALRAAHVFPAAGASAGEGPLVIAVVYRAAFAVLGGWIAARLAPSSPSKHAWVLGGVGVFFATLGAAGQWNIGHHWYPLSLIALAIPATLAGAHILIWSRTCPPRTIA